MYFQKFARVLSLKKSAMKSTHEEGGIRMQQMVLAALENLKRISATIDDTDAFVLLFSVPDSQTKHFWGKVITSETEACHY